MNLKTRKEIIRILGKKSLFSEPIELVGKTNYITGNKYFDTIDLDGKVTKIILRPKGLEVKLSGFFKSYSLAFFKDNKSKCIIEHKDSFKVKKDKSVIGRSAVGLAVLGPLAAIIGGMSALNSKTSIVYPDALILLQNEKQKLLFSVSKDNLIETKDFFHKSGINIEEEYGEKETFSSKDRYSELEKVSKLYKEGFLTQSEFENEKLKILNYNTN